MAKTRFLFATDLHGSEVVWRKFLNCAKPFKLDALVISGDMTGKMIIPIVTKPDGTYGSTLYGKDYVLTEDELPAYMKKIRFIGLYPHIVNEEELNRLSTDKKYLDETFKSLMVKTVGFWLSLIPERVPDHVRIILCPGNDDALEIDEAIKRDPRVIYGESNVVDLDGEHEVATSGWTNPTPWDTPRECSEEELLERLESTVAKVKRIETAVFCFHCPPYDTEIDKAPKLDKDLTPVYEHGSPLMIPVGCRAVRQVIEKYQPLLALHGHIHESSGYVKIGRTYCVNPGSEYGEGILRAYLVEVDGKKVKRLQRVEA